MSVLGWLYLLVGCSFTVDVIRHPRDEWDVCEDQRKVQLPWWVPFSNWFWDKAYWGVMLVLFWAVLAWPYLFYVRPRLHGARLALAAASKAEGTR